VVSRCAHSSGSHRESNDCRVRRAPPPVRSGPRARGAGWRRGGGRAMVLTCVVCRGADFDETEEGFYVCHLCGTQSQDVVREVEDEELQFNTAGAGKTRGARRVQTPSRRGDASPAPATHGSLAGPSGSPFDAIGFSEENEKTSSLDAQIALDRVVAYCDGVQSLLRKQCEWLVHERKFPEEITGVVRRLWLAYLDGVGVLETDFDDPNAFRVSSEAEADSEDSEESASSSSSSASDESGEDTSRDADADEAQRNALRVRKRRLEARERERSKKKRRMTFRRFVARRLPVRMTLSLCYLACLVLRAPVHCGDVVRWALAGDLPFLAESFRIAKKVAETEPPAAAAAAGTVNGTGTATLSRKKKFETEREKILRERFSAPLATALVARSVPATHLVASFATRIAWFAERNVSVSSSFPRAVAWRFPPTNASAFIARFCGELPFAATSVRKELAKRALRCLALYQSRALQFVGTTRAGLAGGFDPDHPAAEPRPGALPKNKRRTRRLGVPAPPHAHAAALVVAAAKTLFDLARAAPQTFQATTSRCETLRGFQENADAFLGYCRDHALGGKTVGAPLDRVVANLWRAYALRTNSDEFSETRTEPETEEMEGEVTRFPEARFLFEDGFRTGDPNEVPSPLKKKMEKEKETQTRARHEYWVGPPSLDDLPEAYIALVTTLASSCCVAPEALHACVRDVDAALEARESGLRAEAKKLRAETVARRDAERSAAGKKRPGRPLKRK